MSETPKKWNKLTVSELREELNSRGLSPLGRKVDLVKRLTDNENTGEEPEGNIEEAEPQKEEMVQVERSSEEVEDPQEEEMEQVEEVENFKEEVKDELQEEEMEEVGGVENCNGEVKADLQDEGMEQIEEEVENSDEEVNAGEQEEEMEQVQDTSEVAVEKFEQEEDGNYDDEKEVEQSCQDTEDRQAPEETLKDDGQNENMGGEINEGQKTGGLETNAGQEETKVIKPTAASEATEEKKLYQPMKYAQFCNWIEQQNRRVRKERSLYIKAVRSKKDMCTVLHDWAKRATDFCIAYGRNGDGNALLSFLTDGDVEEAKKSLSESLGKEKVHHVTGYTESEVTEFLSVSFKSKDYADRSLVLEGIPSSVGEEEICLYFPEAKLICRPFKKSDLKVELPDGIENHFYIAFPDSKTATEAVTISQNIKDSYKQAVVKEMSKYLADYKKYEAEVLKKMKITADTKVFSDKERIEMCKAYRGMDSQVALLKKKKPKPSAVELKKKMKSRDELREAIDADTNQRVRLGMWKFPEHSNIMTGHTKAELKKIIERKREDKSKWRDASKGGATKDEGAGRKKKGQNLDISLGEDMTKVVDEVFLGRSRAQKPSEDKDGYTAEMRKDMSKLIADERGFFTVSVVKEGNFSDREDLKNIFKKYGNVTDLNFTKKRGYVRYATKIEAVTALRDLHANFEKWQPMVPTSNSKYLGLTGKESSETTDGISGTSQRTEEQMLAAKAMKVTVTNIKQGTSVNRVRQLMMKFGPLGFVKLGQGFNNTLTATVTYKDVESSRKALQARYLKLDDKRLKLSPADKSMQPVEMKPTAEDGPRNDQNTSRKRAREEIEDDRSLVDKQIFVGGINPKTNLKALREYFGQFGSVDKVYIFRDNNAESRGIANVTFTSVNTPPKAVRQSHHSLDGRTLKVVYQKGSKFNTEERDRHRNSSEEQGRRRSSLQDRDRRHSASGRDQGQGQRKSQKVQDPGHQSSTLMASQQNPLQGMGLQSAQAFPQMMMANTFGNQNMVSPVNTNLLAGSSMVTNPLLTGLQPGLGGQGLGAGNPLVSGLQPGLTGQGLSAVNPLLTGVQLGLGGNDQNLAASAGLGQQGMTSDLMRTMSELNPESEMLRRPHDRARLERTERGRAEDYDEGHDRTKRRRVGDPKEGALLQSVMKDISTVLSSTLSGLGPRDAKTTLTALQDALASKSAIAQRPSQAQGDSAGRSRSDMGRVPGSASQLMGYDSLQGAQELALKEQLLKKQQEQMLLQRQQEQQLQRELLELQKMKEAAMREAAGFKDYPRRM